MTLKNLLLAPIALMLISFLSLGAVTAEAAGPTLLVGLDPLTITQNGPNPTYGVTFANIRFDATQSSEDILVSRIPMSLNVGNGAVASTLQNCRVVNSNNPSIPLNTGGNAMTSVSSSALNTFNLDSSLRVPMGSSVIASIVCDIAASNAVNNTYQFTINPANVVATSAITNTTVIPTTGSGVIVGSGTSVVTSGGNGVVAVAPTLPNTGAGGEAAQNIALIIGSLVLLGTGIIYTTRKTA